MWNQSKIKKITFITIWLLISIYYFNIYNLLRIPYKWSFIQLDTQSPSFVYKDSSQFIINTPGCVIPNFTNTYKSIEATDAHKTCGKRKIRIHKLPSRLILFDLDISMRGSSISCCYEFGYRSNVTGRQDTQLEYSKCVSFKHNSTAPHSSEVILVECRNKRKKTVYTDHYAILREVDNANTTKTPQSPTGIKWNVLILGMDTMSRYRFLQTMPKTAQYVKANNWLEYRGYNKVGDNTFPNLITLLTAESADEFDKKCYSRRHKLSLCNNLMLWSDFKRAEYTTAYGEDWLNIPDTFRSRNGWENPPTDHYMRPFFLMGETFNGNTLCAGQLPSAVQLLNYAEQFATTYRNQGFFGFFWSNSYSHNSNNLPSLLDQELVKFFTSLEDSGVLENTIIVFMSDHGKRFGPETITNIESHYSSRLPMLYIKTPAKFNKLHSNEYNYMLLNQHRLTSPFDLQITLLNTLKLSNPSFEIPPGKACPHCKSFFEEISDHRTCADAMISDRWCSCHNVSAVALDSDVARESAEAVMFDIRNRIKTIKTQPCTQCEMLEVNKIFRCHSYQMNNTMYYIVAFSVKPSDIVYDGTVMSNGNNYRHLGPSTLLVPYNKIAKCALKAADKSFCACKKMTSKNCVKPK